MLTHPLFRDARRAWTILTLLTVLYACACGCAYGPPEPSVIARPEIPAAAAPVYEWSAEKVTVTYYWHKVNKYDIDIDAKAYFPADYKDAADAVWQVKFQTIPTADLGSVPGSYLGILRNYVDPTGATQYEIVPPVFVPELKDGMYGLIENGVTFDPADPKKILSIQPILHIRMVKNQAIDPYYDMPVYLTPKKPSDLTPLPKISSKEDGPRGTPLTMPSAAPEGHTLDNQPIPGVTGAGGVGGP